MVAYQKKKEMVHVCQKDPKKAFSIAFISRYKDDASNCSVFFLFASNSGELISDIVLKFFYYNW